MGTSTLTSNPGSSGIPAPPGRKWRSSDLTLYVLLAALTYGAWWLSGRGYYRSGDRVGYWLGVTGGSMLLVLLLYPLRKYLRFMQRWGKVKWWFVGHMVLGIGGPLLILLHSTFSLRSANASVALISMLIVAISGVVGRFLYLRVHRGLQGQRDNLVDLQRKAGFAEGEVRSRFRFAPEVAERLLAFEASALQEDAGWWALDLPRLRTRSRQTVPADRRGATAEPGSGSKAPAAGTRNHPQLLAQRGAGRPVHGL